MSYTEPDSTAFLARFPRFSNLGAPALTVLDAVLAEAIKLVDDSWVEEDRAEAQLYLAAHLLVQETTGSTDRPAIITAESLGPMSVSYGVGGGMTDFSTTEYGRRYARMRNANFPGVLVV